MALTLKPRIGAQDFVYALLTESSDVIGGTPVYGTVYPIAGLVKIGVKVNGKAETMFADDAARLMAETIGKIEISVDMGDLLPADVARLLGHTYSNGQMGAMATDMSPYVAIGFKIMRAGTDQTGLVPAFDYFWFYKGKFAKGDIAADTKADSIKWQNQSLVGQFGALISNNLYRNWLRTDDPAVIPSVQAAFFSQVTFPSADLTAFTAVLTTGTGATKTLLLTLSKASNSGTIPFTLPASSLTALLNELQLLVGSTGIATPFTVALLSAGTGFSNSPITLTITTTLAATALMAAIRANSAFVDGSGVALTAYQSGSVTTHA